MMIDFINIALKYNAEFINFMNVHNSEKIDFEHIFLRKFKY